METRLALPIGVASFLSNEAGLTEVKLNGNKVTDISSMIVLCQALKTTSEDLQLKALEFFSSKQSSMFKRLGDFWFDREEYSKALAAYEQRYDSSPRDVSNLVSMGGCLYLLEDLRNAEVLLRRALSLQHECFPALVNISLVLNDSYRWSEASAFIEHAMLKKPSNQFARLEFAISCVYLKQTRAADAILASLEENNNFPSFFKSRLIFARALSAKNDGNLGLCEDLLLRAYEVCMRGLYEHHIRLLRSKIFERHEKFLVWRDSKAHVLNLMGEHLFRRVVRYV